MRLSVRVLSLLAVFFFADLMAYGFTSQPSKYFFNRADFATGKAPYGVAIADMNGDGRADLVVANSDDPSVSILLGQSDGTFATKTDFPAGDYPVALVTGDFNGDGKIDVAVTTTTGVAVLLGNGDGTLSAPTLYTSQAPPFSLAAADFNHDGKLDLAVAGVCGTTCGFAGIMLGKGDGTFQAEKDYSAGGVPNAFTVFDLNGDGVLDLAFANMATNSFAGGTPGLVSVLLGNSDGTFQAAVNYPSGANISGIAAGDVTGDKIPDLVVTHSFGATISLQKGNGDGTFQSEQPISTDTSLGSQFIQLIDLNSDGKLDLLMSSVDNSGAAVLMGNGDGTFQPFEAYATGVQPYFFAVADVNGDRNNDLAVVDSEGDYATILLGNGDGTFSPRKNLPLGSSLQAGIASAALGDFDGDGKLDLAVAEYSQSVVAVLPGNGDGTFRQPLTSNLIQAGTINPSSAADFNRDGHLDLLVSGTTMLLGKGDGTFGTPIAVNSDINIRSFVVGDFNGDGYADIVDVGNGYVESQPLQVFLGNGDGTFQPVRRFWNLTSIPDKSVAADFNHDGKLDLALTVYPNGVAVLLGNGDGTFAAPVIYPTDDLPNGLNVADLNGDGKLDLIATGSKVDVFLGNGDGTFATSVNYPVTGFPQQLVAGDFDGDGKPDIAVTAFAGGPGTLEILFGNGDGTFQTPVLYTDDASVGAPVLARDLNGDQVDDLFVAAPSGSLFVSAPLATVSPSLLDFGTVPTGTTSDSKVISVTNSGNGPLDVSGATVASPFGIVGSVCGTELSRLQSCTIPVVFSPTTLGIQDGQVLIQESALNSKPVVLVAGLGGAPMLTVTPASIGFTGQDVNTSSAPRTITLTNTSNAPVTFSSIKATGPFSEKSQCGTVLAASGTCSISVVFAPLTLGQQNGSITITDDVAGSPQIISLRGSGEPALSITPQSGGSASATVKSGQPATYQLALTAGPNFSGTVSLTCSGAPVNALCSMSSSSFTLTGGGTQTFTVTVTTSQQVAMTLMDASSLRLASLGYLSCVVLLSFGGRVGIARWYCQIPLFLVLVTTASLLVIGCGGGSSAGTQQSTAAVAPGTYPMMITAGSGSTAASQSLTLVVQ